MTQIVQSLFLSIRNLNDDQSELPMILAFRIKRSLQVIIALGITSLLFLDSSLAQGSAKLSNSQFFQGIRIHQGSILIHSRELRPIKNSYPFGIEFDLGWHKNSTKTWSQCHCAPKIGISLAFWNFDNREVLGMGGSGMFYLQPVFSAERRLSYAIRSGIGISYQNMPYDPKENPDNLSYSTKLAFPLQLGVAFNYRLNEQWSFDIHALYNHISNGGMKDPNKGINWPSLAVGLTRYLHPVNFSTYERESWNTSDATCHLTLSVLTTYQEPKDGLYYFSPGIETKIAQQVSRINMVGASVEYFYDSFRASQSSDNNGDQMGIGLSHIFILGKFRFNQDFFAYLNDPTNQGADFYQRYGLNYGLNSHWKIGISLKAHGHVADFIDLRFTRLFMLN